MGDVSDDGFIDAEQLYRLDVFQRRLTLGTAAMRELRRAGLRILTIGRRRYVLGADVIAHLQSRRGDHERA